MPCPRGASLGIPPVAASASSSRLSGKTCTFLFPLELSGEEGPPPPILVFRGGLVILDQLFGFHPWGGVSSEDDQGGPRLVPTGAIICFGRRWSS